MAKNEDEEMRAAIRGSLMRFLRCEDVEADFVLNAITETWSLKPEQLPQFLALLAVPHLGITPTAAAVGLYVLERWSHTEAGRMVIRQAAKAVAAIEREDAAPGN